jgi:hypothetical protein
LSPSLCSRSLASSLTTYLHSPPTGRRWPLFVLLYNNTLYLAAPFSLLDLRPLLQRNSRYFEPTIQVTRFKLFEEPILITHCFSLLPQSLLPTSYHLMPHGN